MDNLKTCGFPYISIYPTWIHDESRGFSWIHVMWFVIGYLKNLGKPWKALELFRFPWVSMFYDVDFPVDFLQKKIPDDCVKICNLRNITVRNYGIFRANIIVNDLKKNLLP